MIRLKQVTTVLGETTLVFQADFPDKTVKEITIPLSDLHQRLKQVRTLLGRPLTMQDSKEALIAIINELRRDSKPLPERFDFSIYIGKDLEAE